MFLVDVVVQNNPDDRISENPEGGMGTLYLKVGKVTSHFIINSFCSATVSAMS